LESERSHDVVTACLVLSQSRVKLHGERSIDVSASLDESLIVKAAFLGTGDTTRELGVDDDAQNEADKNKNEEKKGAIHFERRRRRRRKGGEEWVYSNSDC